MLTIGFWVSPINSLEGVDKSSRFVDPFVYSTEILSTSSKFKSEGQENCCHTQKVQFKPQKTWLLVTGPICQSLPSDPIIEHILTQSRKNPTYRSSFKHPTNSQKYLVWQFPNLFLS